MLIIQQQDHKTEDVYTFGSFFKILLSLLAPYFILKLQVFATRLFLLLRRLHWFIRIFQLKISKGVKSGMIAGYLTGQLVSLLNIY